MVPGAHLLSRVLGYGAYTGSGGSIDQDIPIISNPEGTDGPITIRNREYISDVVIPANAAGAFQVQQTLPLNAGMSQTWPWLSQIANNFSQYRLEGVQFHYVPTSGSIASQMNLGEVIMAVNYNPSENTFVSKQQMLNQVMSTSVVSCNKGVCAVECNPHQSNNGGLLDVRGGTVTSDLRFSDLGFFSLATQGQPNSASAQTIGELWVTYQVALYKPNLASGSPSNTKSAHYAQPVNGTVSTTNIFGVNVQPVFDYIGVKIYGNRITFPSTITDGVFQITMAWNSNTAVAWSLANPSLNGCQYVKWADNSSKTLQIAPNINLDAGASTHTLLVTFFLAITTTSDNPAYIDMGTAVTIGTSSATDVVINPLFTSKQLIPNYNAADIKF